MIYQKKNITLVFNYSSTDGIYDNKYLGYYGNNQWANYISKLKKGLNIINYTIPKDGDYNYIWIGEVKKELSSNVAQTISNLMVLKGDWTNRDIPGYFEGIQSSFEDQLVTQEMIDSGEEKVENLGKYKVEVKTTGKNKFDYRRIESRTINGVTYVVNNDGTILGNGIVGKYNAYWDVATSETLPLEGTYTFSGGTGVNINGTYYNCPKTVTLAKNCRYKFYITNNNEGTIVDNKLYKPQIEEDSVATEYEPYKECINTFYLNSPLLEGDTIEYINGQAYHVHNSASVILDGSDDEGWASGVSSQNTGKTMYFASPKYDKIINRGDVVSDRFISYSTWDTDCESIYSEHGVDNDYKLRIRINKSKLQTEDVSGFKSWLKNNPVIAISLLKEPIYEPIKADLSVQLFEGTTHISNNSNIPANMEIIVDRAINRAIEAIKLAKINPTVSNISKARMWINLLDDSIKKDELQDRINSITDIEDLQLERKTITSNIDIYVKLQNMLLMSVSTNKIIFEDYSSVSDLDMDNAVRITVNSSLPYNLNSYLETEIQNNDGSSKINKELLHIKEDSDNKYKQFLGINQKLTLKEDCEAGKNNIHDIDLRLKASSYDADIYKTVIKFEAEQK